MTDTNNINNTEELFDGGDFVFMARTGEDGKQEIVGGGYKVNSFFLQEGIAPMTTYNSPDQNGGKVSSPFENLAVPAGLFYINMRVPKYDSEKSEQIYQNHQSIPDDMVDKLFGLVEADKKRKRKTRKYSSKIDKSKTRKHK
jgi:hypothetical protein